MDPITLALAKKYTDKKIKDSSGPVGEVSWNDLTDRPFGEEVKRYTVNNVDNFITIEGLPGVGKASDLIIPHESLIGMVATFGNGSDLVMTQEFYDEALSSGNITDDFVNMEFLLIIYTAGASLGGYVFPETGIYMVPAEMDEISISWTETTLTSINPKFLPIPQLVIFYNDDSREATCSMTYDELSNILAQKKLLTTSYTFIDDASYYFGNVNDISKNSDQIKITATADMTSRRFVLSLEGFWLSVE